MRRAFDGERTWMHGWTRPKNRPMQRPLSSRSVLRAPRAERTMRGRDQTGPRLCARRCIAVECGLLRMHRRDRGSGSTDRWRALQQIRPSLRHPPLDRCRRWRSRCRVKSARTDSDSTRWPRMPRVHLKNSNNCCDIHFVFSRDCPPGTKKSRPRAALVRKRGKFAQKPIGFRRFP